MRYHKATHITIGAAKGARCLTATHTLMIWGIVASHYSKWSFIDVERLYVISGRDFNKRHNFGSRHKSHQCFRSSRLISSCCCVKQVMTFTVDVVEFGFWENNEVSLNWPKKLEFGKKSVKKLKEKANDRYSWPAWKTQVHRCEQGLKECSKEEMLQSGDHH